MVIADELKKLTNEQLDELHAAISKAKDSLNPDDLKLTELLLQGNGLAVHFEMLLIEVFKELATRNK